MNGKAFKPIDFTQPVVESTQWDRLWKPAPDEWFSTAPPARRWLFRDARRPETPGVFPLGKAGQLVASGGVGKTMALVALARAVATGGSWLGAFPCNEPGAVLLLLGEEDAEEAHRRLYNEARRNGVPPTGSIVVMPLHGHPCALLETDREGNPHETSFARWVRSQIATRDDWRLVVVDPMSRFAGVDAETNNRLATRYVQVIESFCTSDRCALSSHHTPLAARGNNPTSAPRGRGVTAGFDGFRWECALAGESVRLPDVDVRERLGEIVTLSFTKSNYSRRPEPLSLRRDDHGALIPLDDVDTAMVAEARSGDSARKAKTAEREAERTRVLADRRRVAEEQRRIRETAEAEETRVREFGDDETVRRIVIEQPGIAGAALEANVCTARRCGSARARRAMQRSAVSRPLGGRTQARGWYPIGPTTAHLEGSDASSFARPRTDDPPTTLDTLSLVQTSEGQAPFIPLPNERDKRDERDDRGARRTQTPESNAKRSASLKRLWAKRKGITSENPPPEPER